jgi:3-oxosteroid 1-dehydrogenase
MDQVQWDEEVDVLVVGGGAGGMTAALVAATKGAKTLLCEKSDRVGGTTAWSGGSIWIPASDQAKAAGFSDTPEEGLLYLESESKYPSAAKLRKAYIETGPIAVTYLEQKTEVKFYPVPNHPDYLTHPGAKGGGRPLAAIPFNGRRLGKDIDLLRAPLKVWTVLGGMMVAREDLPHLLNVFRNFTSFWYSAKLVLGYAYDKVTRNRAMRLVLGNALAGRLLYSLRRSGCDIRVSSPLVGLIRDESGVLGGRFETNGQSKRIRARKGVILAAGGFPHSKKWREKLMPKNYAAGRSSAFEGNVGDSLEFATAIGAAVEQEHAAPGFHIPLSFMKEEDGSESIWLHSWDRAKPGLIIVNRDGRRFANEAQSYHNFVREMHRLNGPEIAPSYVICDSDHLLKYGFGLIRPGTRNVKRYLENGYLLTGNTIDQLARAASINPEQTVKTVADFNEAAKIGVDKDFGRGESPLDRINGDPSHGPNPCMGQMLKAPFYAIEIWPGDIGTSVGLSANTDAQVLDTQGLPIPGLYVCGNDMSSVMRGHYPGPGITLGPAMVFAYRAALHATSGRATHTANSPETEHTRSIA